MRSLLKGGRVQLESNCVIARWQAFLSEVPRKQSRAQGQMAASQLRHRRHVQSPRSVWRRDKGDAHMALLARASRLLDHVHP